MDAYIFVLWIASTARASASTSWIAASPVTLEVKDAPQYFRLQHTVPAEDSSPTNLHRETFLVTRFGNKEPHVRASLQHVQDQKSVPWDVLGARGKGIRGEVIKGEVTPSDPVAHVLLYRTGTDLHSRIPQNPCVSVQAIHHGDLRVQGYCRIETSLDVCVAELHFPSSWFSLVSLPLNVTLNYSASEECKYYDERSEIAGVVQLVGVNTPKVQRLSIGDYVTITLPDKTLLPGELFTASISLQHNWTQPLFSLRVRCRTGLELLFARSAAPNTWAIKTETQKGAKHHTIIGHLTHRGSSDRRTFSVVALLDFLVGNVSVGSAVSRRITFQLDGPGASAASGGFRGSAEVLVSDRDLRAIIPLVKSNEILNTALLTGISQKIPVRVLALEAGGHVLDVTKQAGCETPSAQIVQVSDGCDFLFVGGKETQGAVDVKVEFWLERLRSSLSLSLWVPLLPLRVEVSDTNLQLLPSSGSFGYSQDENDGERKVASDRRSQSCQAQYQRAQVRFLAHFVAHSLDGSRQLTYFVGSDWLLDVSPLIRSQAVVRDHRVARLEEEGSVLIGQQPGVTSVEVRSPLSHSILGEQTIYVSLETVSILELHSHLVWGINLNVIPSSTRHPGVFTVFCQSQEAAMIPKQESVMSVWLMFSDMSIAPLTLYDPRELSLSVVSSDNHILSVHQPMMSAHSWSLPVLIFESPGEGLLLRTSLHLPERCRGDSSGLLSAGYVRVMFPRNVTDSDDNDILQSDSDLTSKDSDTVLAVNNVIPGTSDIILRSDNTVTEDDESLSGIDDIVTTRWGIPGLEEGLYGLLALFCLLTLLFFISCLAFIRRHRKKSAPEGPGNPEAPNWVWLEGPEANGARSHGGVSEEEEEREQWEDRETEPQSLTSTFHPVRNFHGPGTTSGYNSDVGSLSTPKSHSRACLEAKKPEVLSLKSTITQGDRKMERGPDDPSVRSILVASEEDIMWVCKDMGMREPQEILSYMERIRSETPHKGERRREVTRGAGMDVAGTTVRKLT
ncbi:transmembrane protein 132A [Mantella aurantiaca]